MRNIALAAGLVALVIWSSACGNDGLSSQVTVSVIPSRPVVISANYTQAGGTVETQPWFSFQVNVANDSSESVIVVALNITVTGISPQGQVVTATTSLGTTSGAATFICNTNPPATLTLVPNPTFVTIAPGTQSHLSLSFVPQVCPTGSTNNPPSAGDALFYVDSNPDPATGAVVSYFYQVTMSPEGYFSSDGITPDSRLQMQTSFVTQ